MSTLLEPGECVRWKHEGGWKVGRVLTEWDTPGGYVGLVVQCPEGIYEVCEEDTERQPMRAEWEGKE